MKRILATFVLMLFLVTETLSAQQGFQFEVKLNAKGVDAPVSGRLLVYLSRHNTDPMNGPDWFNPEPFFAKEVTNLEPGGTVVIDGKAMGFPESLDQLYPGDYFAQAMLDKDFYHAKPTDGPGNIHSKPKKISIGPDDPASVELELTRVVRKRTLKETKLFKVVSLKSKLLSEFHGREVIEQAGVVFPRGYYQNTEKRYPVYYVITGFGATVDLLDRKFARMGQPKLEPGEEEFIWVYLAGECKWGHHVYANSATNGPRGDALVNEMIPMIDKQFRTIAKPEARFLGGHSSGGWSSLWLQVNYPDMFGGVWSTAPDPVDFRDWQGTNIYDEGGTSVFFDKDGNKRPAARRVRTPVIWYQDFCKMDDVMGRGGQLRSFEAVFSPRGEDGLPVKCWDRETGKVNPDVVNYWKNYDISLKLEKEWAELGPKLSGKIHVYMGSLDTFYLEGATRLLGDRLKKLGSDAVVEFFNGKDHSNLLSPKLRKQIRMEMSEKFREGQKK